jgi:hypothetical protein
MDEQVVTAFFNKYPEKHSFSDPRFVTHGRTEHFDRCFIWSDMSNYTAGDCIVENYQVTNQNY